MFHLEKFTGGKRLAALGFIFLAAPFTAHLQAAPGDSILPLAQTTTQDAEPVYVEEEGGFPWGLLGLLGLIGLAGLKKNTTERNVKTDRGPTRTDPAVGTTRTDPAAGTTRHDPTTGTGTTPPPSDRRRT